MFHDMWGFGMWMGWIFWLVIIAVIIWGVKTLADSNRGRAGDASGETALDVLKKRYARGEISDEEFEQKKQRLSN